MAHAVRGHWTGGARGLEVAVAAATLASIHMGLMANSILRAHYFSPMGGFGSFRTIAMAGFIGVAFVVVASC